MRYHLHMESKENNDTNELIYGTETDSNFQKKKKKLWLPKGKCWGEGSIRSLRLTYTYYYT